jgi:hypothetical protein
VRRVCRYGMCVRVCVRGAQIPIHKPDCGYIRMYVFTYVWTHAIMAGYSGADTAIATIAIPPPTTTNQSSNELVGCRRCADTGVRAAATALPFTGPISCSMHSGGAAARNLQ